MTTHLIRTVVLFLAMTTAASGATRKVGGAILNNVSVEKDILAIALAPAQGEGGESGEINRALAASIRMQTSQVQDVHNLIQASRVSALAKGKENSVLAGSIAIENSNLPQSVINRVQTG